MNAGLQQQKGYVGRTRVPADGGVCRMGEAQISYHRNLPHWQPEEVTFFITFRLAGSLPKAVLEDLLRERRRAMDEARAHLKGHELPEAEYRLEKRHFGRFDAWLDRCAVDSPTWLAQERVARIVMDELQRLDGIRYRLLALCVMPNHVHVLLDDVPSGAVAPGNQAGATRTYPLADALRLVKGRTSRSCNQVLGRSGAFWHPESYDHVVRSDQEGRRILAYLVRNPVSAGLVSEWESWPFTTVRAGLFESL